MKMSSGDMSYIKEERIQISSEWSCNGKNPGFSRGNLFAQTLLFPADYQFHRLTSAIVLDNDYSATPVPAQ